MRVLVACEFSGVVRQAFRKRGHDAWSCDLLPAEDMSHYHIQGDARNVIHGGHIPGLLPPSHKWDLMIAHPPCTYLANSGVRWLGEPHINRERWNEMTKAKQFFRDLLEAPIEHICVENPIQHKYGKIRQQDQLIQPWQFGHGETKATCLWLKNLPLLVPTDIVEGREARVHKASPGPDRWKERSRTLKGIAEAMATQWGDLQATKGGEET